MQMFGSHFEPSKYMNLAKKQNVVLFSVSAAGKCGTESGQIDQNQHLSNYSTACPLTSRSLVKQTARILTNFLTGKYLHSLKQHCFYSVSP